MKKTSSQYSFIFGFLGMFLFLIGITCLLPLFLLIFYPDESNYWLNFFIPGVAAIVLGMILSFTLLRKKTVNIKLGKHIDSVLLVVVWISAIIICAIPFFLKEGMNFTQAVFETTSGFSTIGLTVYTDFDCHLYVFYRALLTLIGGVGLVLLITTIVSGKYGVKLYLAEGHNDKLVPNIRKSALIILGIYTGIILLGTIAYCIAGVPVFDSLVHSISAVATGGFSSKAGGLTQLGQEYNNMLALEIISVVLMILGSINFLTHLLFLTRRYSAVFKDCEIRLLCLLALIFVPLFFITTFAGYDWKNPLDALRHGSFTFFTAITTTGFSNVSDIRVLGEATLFLVVIMNVIGGGAGSTAGGVKQYRVVVAAKYFYWSTREKLSPSRMIYPHFINRLGEEKEITHKDALEAYGYILLYLIVMAVGGLIVTLFSGFSFGDSLFEFSNAISSTGLSNGLTAACSNNHGVLWTLILGMFAGRLEILAIYFAFFRIGRDILRKETV